MLKRWPEVTLTTLELEEDRKKNRMRGGKGERCKWCHGRCDGSCADLTPAEIAYTDRLIAEGVISR